MIEEKAKYKKTAEKLIKTVKSLEYIKNSAVRIVYLSSDVEKKKNHKVILADCAKVNDRYSWCCPYDFMITIYEPNVVGLNSKQMEILLQHELRHVGIDTEGNEDSFYVVPHDIEDFREIIDQYGLDWNKREDK